MATPRIAVETSFVNISDGKIVKIWHTAELVDYLNISIATFKRDKALLAKYCPELHLLKRARIYSDRHRHAFNVLRDWRNADYVGDSLTNKLAEEGLPSYVDYQTRLEKAPSRMSKRR